MPVKAEVDAKCNKILYTIFVIFSLINEDKCQKDYEERNIQWDFCRNYFDALFIKLLKNQHIHMMSFYFHPKNEKFSLLCI